MSELLSAIIDQAHFADEEGAGPNANSIVQEFVQRVADTAESSSKGVGIGIAEAIAQIDAQISTQLTEIMHNSKFQKLEGTWAGLAAFVKGTETGATLKLKVFSATVDEMASDLFAAVEFDQSHLFKEVYEQQYGTFGGNPYSMIVLDHEFNAGNKDISLLRELSGVAAAAHAPLITAAGASFFGMKDFSQLSSPRDLARVLDSSEYAKWKTFRETEDSRYVALTLPRVLARAPFGPNGNPVKDVNFVEDTDGTNSEDFVWSNSCWYFASRITAAFSTYGWTAAIRGVEGGGLVENLPAVNFKTSSGDVELVCPTETPITDRREKELSDLGFIPLVHCKGTDSAAFFGGQTANKAKKYDDDAANANALISARLPYILAASRFAHYFKVMLRDKVGSFESASTIQDFLQGWIGKYILLDDNASHQSKARFPLREARVEVREVPGSPGEYTAIAYLRPHFQLEEISASIRLVAALPA